MHMAGVDLCVVLITAFHGLASYRNKLTRFAGRPYCIQIGVELGYLQQQYQSLGIQKNAFVALMETVPYRMYPVLCIIMALLV